MKSLLHNVTEIEDNGNSSFYKVIHKLAKLNFPDEYLLGNKVYQNLLPSHNYVKLKKEKYSSSLKIIKIYTRIENPVQLKLSLRRDLELIAADHSRVVDLELVLILGFEFSDYKMLESIYWWVYGSDQKVKINVRLKTVSLLQIIFYFNNAFNILTTSNLRLRDEIKKLVPIECKYNNWEKVHYISDKLFEDNLNLFLGAGISIESKLPSWDELIEKLRVWFIIKLVNHTGGSNQISEITLSSIKDHLSKSNGTFPLIEAELYEHGIGKSELIEFVRKELYSGELLSNQTISAIAMFCETIGNSISIKNIITYNYDDLVEQGFKVRRGLGQREVVSITDSDITPISNDNRVNIFHVHGYIPRDKSINEKTHLIFTDSSYNKLYNDIYSWSNIIQLKFLLSSSCLFIGQSGNDPNLRRILSSIKLSAQNRHFIIQKRFCSRVRGSETEYNHSFNNEYNKIVESQFAKLGLEIIWIDDYSEINRILHKIKL